MEGEHPPAGVAHDHGACSFCWKVSWEEMRILGYVLEMNWMLDNANGRFTGWTKFMEWKYPVEVVVRSPTVHKGAGAIQAAASL